MSEAVENATTGSEMPDRGVAVAGHAFEGGPRSVTTLARDSEIAIGFTIGMCVVQALLLGLFLFVPGQLPQWAYDLNTPDSAFGSTMDELVLLCGAIAFILIGRFTYRAMKNLHTVGSRTAKMAPIWTIGWHFVPIANIFQPAIGMSQIYHGTHEAVGEQSRDNSPIPLWWIAYLVVNFPVALAIGIDAEPPLYFALAFATLVLSIIAGVTLIRIIRRVSERQEMLLHGGAVTVFD
jgi:Domain of unknown function (DUF4328)